MLLQLLLCKSNTVKIEKLQKRALRYVALDVNSPYKDILQMCNKSPLYIL